MHVRTIGRMLFRFVRHERNVMNAMKCRTLFLKQ